MLHTTALSVERTLSSARQLVSGNAADARRPWLVDLMCCQLLPLSLSALPSAAFRRPPHSRAVIKLCEGA